MANKNNPTREIHKRVTRSQAKKLRNAQYEKVCRVRISRNKKLDKIAIAQPGQRCLQRARSTHISHDLSPVQPERRRSMDLSKVQSILKIPNGKPRSIFGRRKSVNFAPQDDLSFATSKTNDETFQDNPTSPSGQGALLIDFSDVDSNEPNRGINSNVIPLTRSMIDAKKSAHTTKVGGESMNIQSLLDEFDPLLNSVDSEVPIPTANMVNQENPFDVQSREMGQFFDNEVMDTNQSFSNEIHSVSSSLVDVQTLTQCENNSFDANVSEKKKNRRPVPGLLPYNLSTVPNNANIPSASTSRSKYSHSKTDSSHLFSREELSTAMKEIITKTTKTYGSKSPTFRLQDPDSHSMDVRDTLNTTLASENNDSSLPIEFENDVSFGKLQYTSDSD